MCRIVIIFVKFVLYFAKSHFYLLQLIVLVGFLAVANAGDLSTYVSYAPQQAVHKTLAYAAPVTKAIYQQPAYVSKAIYEHGPAQYNNYHSYNPTYNHESYAHGKVLAAPQQYVADIPHYKTVSASYPVAAPVLKSYATPSYAYEKSYAAPAYAYEKSYATQAYAAPAYASAGYASQAYAAPAYAAPAYASPAYASPAYASSAYAAPSYASSAYATPSYAAQSYGAPAYAYEKSYASPAIVKSVVPSVAYTKSYAAPVLASAAPTIVKSVPLVGHAPTVVKSVYPSIVKSYEPDYHHYGAPAVVKSAAVSYSPASAVSHTSFESANAHYGW